MLLLPPMPRTLLPPLLLRLSAGGGWSVVDPHSARVDVSAGAAGPGERSGGGPCRGASHPPEAEARGGRFKFRVQRSGVGAVYTGMVRGGARRPHGFGARNLRISLRAARSAAADAGTSCGHAPRHAARGACSGRRRGASAASCFLECCSELLSRVLQRARCPLRLHHVSAREIGGVARPSERAGACLARAEPHVRHHVERLAGARLPTSADHDTK